MNRRNSIPSGLAVFLFFGLAGCLPLEPIDLSTLVQEGDLYLDTEMNPYSGPAYGLYPSINLMRANGRLKDGMKVGAWENYHKNGQLKGTGNFSNGELDGPYETYYESGQLQKKTNYSNSELDGPYETYHKNGQLWQNGGYSNGELDGPYERYHENGQLRQKGNYYSNEKCGEWTEDGESVSHLRCPAG